MSYFTNGFDDKVVEMLQAGGVGFMPADTIYGLSCQALDEAAVNNIHQIKKRDEGKPFIILISSITQLDELGIDTSLDRGLTDRYWPGPLTIVFPAPNSPLWLSRGLKSLAVRLPDEPNLQELISRVGPIISTSANEAGEPPIQDTEEARHAFTESLDFYVNTSNYAGGTPSTIVKLTPNGIEVLRQGAVKINEKEII